MSNSDESDIIDALKAQLTAMQAELGALRHRYDVTVIDIGQILRAPDRIRAHLPADQLTEESPVFHREFDPPLLQAIKRKIHRLAQEKAASSERLRDQNPNRNPDRQVITKLLEEICDDALINDEKLPGRRNLAGMAQRLARKRGIQGTVSERAAGEYLKARALQDD